MRTLFILRRKFTVIRFSSQDYRYIIAILQNNALLQEAWSPCPQRDGKSVPYRLCEYILRISINMLFFADGEIIRQTVHRQKIMPRFKLRNIVPPTYIDCQLRAAFGRKSELFGFEVYIVINDRFIFSL